MSETPETPTGSGADPLTEIFHAARELPPGERRAFVERACEGDPELLAELLPLLRVEDATDADAGLETGVVRSVIESLTPTTGLVGRRIGDYELTELLGTGGMGAVYLGVRVAGGFEQRAAVKLLPAGMDTPAARWRFHQERRHLASLSHPSIAQVHAGGLTEDGTPYLIMELVDGEPITDYCDSTGMPVRQRLELFLSVCAAVQHAHEHLVVHRDLKPSNIFVTEDGVPKLLDFGIARELDENARATPGEVTRMGPAFTAAYSSPEQISGDELTTAADVFSLGVILFELLAGERPFGSEPSRDHEDAMRRFVKLPSTDGSTAERRAVSVAELRRTLKGDLSRIVGTAIRDEPDERYQTVADLARDVRRYLERRPVAATPPSLRYRLERLIARRPAEVALGGLIVFFMLYSLAQTVQARLDARRARALSEFVTSTVLLLEPFGDVTSTVTLAEALDSARSVLERRPLRSRAAQLDVLGAMGSAYRRLGRPRDALPLLQRALDPGLADAPDSARARLHNELALAHLQLARRDSAEHHLLLALEAYSPRLQGSDARLRAATLLDSLTGTPTRQD